MIKFLRPVLLCFLVVGSTLCYAQAPNISYATPQAYTVGTTITPLGPVNSGGPVSANGYSVTPSLPLGLVFDRNTGIISGTPAISEAATDYTISAVNPSGGSSTVLNITENLPQPPNITYGGSFVYTTAVPVSPSGPVNTGGPVGAQNPVAFASNTYPRTALVTDAAGNIYAFDISGKLLEKFPATGGPHTIIASGFNNPFALAVDGAGNLYVSNIGTADIKKIPAAGGPPVTFGSGHFAAVYLTADNAGNVYATDDYNEIRKISADGTQTTALHVTGISRITGIAADVAGNLYITDAFDNTLKEIKVNTTQAVKLASDLLLPAAPFVNASGDIYFVSGDNTHIYNGGDTIKRVPAGGGSPVAVSAAPQATGVVFDPAGNLYFSHYANAITYIPRGGYYISPRLPVGLNFDHNTGVISGTPTVPSPATDYAITACNAGGIGSVTVNIAVNHYPFPQLNYSGPNVYSLNRPVAPPLTPTNTNVAAPGNYVTKSVATGAASMPGVAIDASGNAYVTLFNRRMVVKIPPDGSASVILASGFLPAGIAIDKLNNIYVVDYNNYEIKKIPADGSAVVTIASGLNQPYGLAIDAVGNLYVTNLGDGSIQKIPANGGSPVTLTPHFTQPRGVAVDLVGNIYVTDPGDGVIKKISVDNTELAIPLVSSNLQPYGIAVDAKGNVFFTEKTGTALKEIPAGTNFVTSVIPGLSGALSIGTNNKGAFYVGNASNFTSFTPPGGYFITQTLPPGLQLNNNTGVISGTPTSLSPATDYTITAYNQGGSSSTTTNIQVVFYAGLSKLALSTGALNPAFASATSDYSAIVPNSTSSVKLTPTAIEADAAITVNGAAVTSGAASASLPLAVGLNTITIVATSADGLASKTYTVTVTRASNNAALTSLKLSPVTTLATVSGPDFRDYTTIVPNSEAAIKITPTTQDTTATVKVNGVTVVSGAASASIALNVGDNVINTVVTAQDGTTVKTYSIKFTRLPSSNAKLAGLSLSGGTIAPVFAAGTTNYTATVSNAAISLTPTASDATATIKVNGTTVASGTLSAALPLVIGPNVINTVVTAQDSVTTKTYTLTVTRVSTNATLTGLKINPVTTLTTVIGPDFRDYTTTVPNSETSVKITPTTQDATATIKVNGVTVASGTASASIPLNVGDNVINTVVTAQDGTTAKTYSIKFTRLPSSNANLAGLALSSGTLSPVFAVGTTNYIATVSSATVSLTPTTVDAGATLKVNGTTVTSGSASTALPLIIGQNVISTVITAQDGITTKTYEVTVTRLSNNATLSGLKINPATTLTVISGPDFRDYTTTVPNSESTVKITPTVQDATATVKVNGVTLASGTASGSIALNVGTTVVNTVVTAQDGITTKTYSITFARTGPVAGVMTYDQQEQSIITDALTVHQNVSPNGDGNSDVLLIDGIAAYPDNKLQIMSHSGILVYEANGYDNATKVFDSHSSVNGKLQQAGTYFYSLEYKGGKETKRKTGFIVLKY